MGSNAIQLAVAAGYDVIATASPRNFDYVTKLGASEVYDYTSETVVTDVIAALDGTAVAGAIAMGKGSAELCVDILAASNGNTFIAMASAPASFERLAHRRRGSLRLPRILVGTVVSTASHRRRHLLLTSPS